MSNKLDTKSSAGPVGTNASGVRAMAPNRIVHEDTVDAAVTKVNQRQADNKLSSIPTLPLELWISIIGHTLLDKEEYNKLPRKWRDYRVISRLHKEATEQAFLENLVQPLRIILRLGTFSYVERGVLLPFFSRKVTMAARTQLSFSHFSTSRDRIFYTERATLDRDPLYKCDRVDEMDMLEPGDRIYALWVRRRIGPRLRADKQHWTNDILYVNAACEDNPFGDRDIIWGALPLGLEPGREYDVCIDVNLESRVVSFDWYKFVSAFLTWVVAVFGI